MAEKPSVPLWHSFEIQQLLKALTQQQGVPLSRLLKATGVTEEDLSNPGFRLTLDQELELYTHIAHENTDPYLGIHHGRQLGIARFGMLGQAMLGASTVHEAIRLAVKFTPLISWSCELALSHSDLYEGSEFVLTVRPTPEDKLAVEFETDSTFASLHTVINEIVMEEVQFEAVYFSRPKGNQDIQVLENLFRCPVSFGAEVNKIVFSSALMARKLPYAKPEQADLVEEMCNNLVVALLDKYSLEASLKDYVRVNIIDPPSMEKTALHFNISSRTLRRRLLKLGSSYQQIVDEVRFIQAKRILTLTNTSLESVALAVGYNDVRGFRSAFKRWSGITPSSFRSSLKLRII